MGYSATALDDGRILVVGDVDLHDVTSAAIWDPATGTSSAAGALAQARDGHTATVLGDGRVLMVGGFHEGDGLDSAGDLGPIDRGFQPGRVPGRATLEPHRHAPARRPSPDRRWFRGGRGGDLDTARRVVSSRACPSMCTISPSCGKNEWTTP
jgi:hypothetical protein